MRLMILAGAALALSACGGAAEADEANNMSDANLMMNDPMMAPMDPALNGTTNGTNSMGTGSAGGAIDPTTQNMIQKDATTNDPDTNLANGM